jgi:dTDP-4-amino-4,6-dideoxygalactose transaminase
MISIARPQLGEEEKQAVLEVLSLPVHPALTPSDLELIVVRVNEFTPG